MTRSVQSDQSGATTLGLPLSEGELLDILPGAIVVTDRNGRVMLWSAGAESLYGWAEAEVLGRSIVEILSPSEASVSDAQDLAAVAAGNRRTGDRTVVHRDGRLLRLRTTTQPVREDGAVVAIVGFAEDVTALREAQQVQRELSEHLQAALTAGGLGTWRWTTATGEMTWDARLEALFGLPAGGFDGSFGTFLALIDPTERSMVSDAFHAAIESKSEFRIEHQLTWPDGSLHWIATVGAPTVDVDGTVTGALGCSLDVTTRNAQSDERERLSMIAVRAADRERLARERLEFLARINDALLASSTIHELMVNVTSVSVPRLGDWCAIHVFPFEGGSVPLVEVAYTDPAMAGVARRLQDRFPYDPDAPTGVGRVIRTGETEFYPEINAETIAGLDIDDDAREVVSTLELRSAIVVPLNKRGRKLGALQFVMSTSLRQYTSEDVDLVHTIADRIASSIENLRLYEQQRQIARTLQRSLLPAALPTIPHVGIAVRYWPAGEANEVGGDFYDVFALHGPDQWAIVIGDVCGTGAGAAALTGVARHTIRTSAWHDDTPAEVLRALDFAVRNSATHAFLTACYATLATGGDRIELSVTCGGHPLPIHVVAATGTASRIGRPGTLIGMFDAVRFETVTSQLAAGDVVVFYTDGATDVRPPHGLDDQEFSMLVQRAVEHAANAEAIADNIRDALEAVLTFRDRNDDIALLVLTVTDDR